MSCINKSLPEYQKLASIYGDILAEAITRNYNPINPLEFKIPTLEEAKAFSSSKKLAQFKGLVSYMLQGNTLNEKVILSKLKGIIHRYDNRLHVTKGKVDSGDGYESQESLQYTLRPNLAVIETLSSIFNLFKVVYRGSLTTPIITINQSAIANFDPEAIDPQILTEEENYLVEVLKEQNPAPRFDYPIENPISEVAETHIQPTEKQLETVKSLQQRGLITSSPVFYHGKYYYQIPGDTEKNYNSLQQVLINEGIDFVNVFSSPQGYFVGFGEQDLSFEPEAETAISSKAGEITKTKVVNFLKSIGFKVEQVKEIIVNGQKLPDHAMVDLAKALIQITQGKEDYTLPEEAMTVLLYLVKQSRPELYNSMMKDVVNYKLYYTTLQQYQSNPLYQFPDGSPNISKLKEEAISKLLAEYLINRLEGTQESSKRIEQVRSWYEQVIDWVKSFFTRYENPFETTTEEFITDPATFGSELGDVSQVGIFLSAKSIPTLDAENPKSRDIWENIKNKAANLGIYKVDNDYIENGEKVSKGRRVSTMASAAGNAYFRNRNIEDIVQEFYDKSREDGSYLHQIFEEYLKAYIDPKTGLVLARPAKVVIPASMLDYQQKHQIIIAGYVKEFLNSYPAGTRFLVEQIIHDPNAINKDKSKGRFGTIDVLAILPDSLNNRVDLVDWKSTLIQNNEEIKDYKKTAVRIQLNEYNRILREVYGVENTGKVRGIPIYKNYRQHKVTKEPVLQNIVIGDVDATKIDFENRGLRPIIADAEVGPNKTMNMLAERFQALYEKYIEQKAFRDDPAILNDLQEAIYEIRTASQLVNAAAYFSDLSNRFDTLIASTKNIIESKDIEATQEALTLITFYEQIIEKVATPILGIHRDPDIPQETKDQIVGPLNNIIVSKEALHNMRKELMEPMANQESIFDLQTPEKAANFWQRWMRFSGSQDIATFKYLTKIIQKTKHLIDINTDNHLKSLKNHKKEIEKWAKDNNKSWKDVMNLFISTEKGKLHSKIDISNFSKERREALESKDGTTILKFIKKNYNLADYKVWYAKKLKENIELWKKGSPTLTKKENDKVFQRRLTKFRKDFDIFEYPVTAFNPTNYRVWGRNIKEELWYSEEYKAIKDIPQLEGFYRFLLDRNKELADTGAISDYDSYTFLPNIMKGAADILMFDDKNILAATASSVAQGYRNFRRSITVENYELNEQGKRDKLTGQKLDERFIPYVDKLDNDYDLRLQAAISLKIIDHKDDIENLNKRISKWRAESPTKDKAFAEAVAKQRTISYDIFSIYGYMIKETQKAKYISQQEEIVQALHQIEKNKKNIQKNKFGVPTENPDGSLAETTSTGGNAQMFEEQMRAFLYGETLQMDNDFVITSPFKLRQRWNNSFFGKLGRFDIDPLNYDPTRISASKLIMKANAFNSKRVLGINLGAVLSAMFGGQFSANKLYSKYLTKEDIAKGFLKLTSGAFYTSDTAKKQAAFLDYFLPLLDNKETLKTQRLSVSQSVAKLSGDWIMLPLRKASEMVQINAFFGLLENTGLIDGRLVNLREKAMKDSNFFDVYESQNLSEAKKAKKQEFENLLEEYKEKYALTKHATFEKDSNGETYLEIPGMERTHPDIQKFREIIQNFSRDALGETDEYNVQNYKLKILGRLFMTFKNWIPPLSEVRWAEFHYDQTHDSWEYGRYRAFIRGLSANLAQSFLKILPLPYLTGKATSYLSQDALISKAKAVYQELKAEQQKIGKFNSKNFISEGEFIDKFLADTNAAFSEVRMLMLFFLAVFMGFAAPDDDDTPSEKAFKAIMRKQIDKFSDEVGFFMSPKSAVDTMGGSIAPIMGLVRDFWGFGSHLTEQFFGFTFEQVGFEEKGLDMQESAKPIKKLFKVAPVTKEFINYMPFIDEDIAKDWGVRISDRRLLQ